MPVQSLPVIPTSVARPVKSILWWYSPDGTVYYDRLKNTAESLGERLHPEDRLRVRALHHKSIAAAEGYEAPVRVRNTHDTYDPYQLRAVPQYGLDGSFTGMLGSLRAVDSGVSSTSPLFRCRRNFRHPLAKPSIVFQIDGTLANVAQWYIDQLCLLGEQGYRGCLDWRQLTTRFWPLSCAICPEATHQANAQLSRLLHFVTASPTSWDEVPAFPDVSIADLHDRMDTEQFVGQFIASRYFLNPCYEDVEQTADSRLLTRRWLLSRTLAESGADRFAAMNIAADCCYNSKDVFLSSLNADWLISDDPDEVLLARSVGIYGYLVDRPWNRYASLPFRVQSVSAFLDMVDTYTKNTVDA